MQIQVLPRRQAEITGAVEQAGCYYKNSSLRPCVVRTSPVWLKNRVESATAASCFSVAWILARAATFLQRDGSVSMQAAGCAHVPAIGSAAGAETGASLSVFRHASCVIIKSYLKLFKVV